MRGDMGHGSREKNVGHRAGRHVAQDAQDKAFQGVLASLFVDDAQLLKQFQNNESFRHGSTETVFGLTYDEP